MLAAGDGRSAVEAAERAHPALIILDLMLPQMDGIEVTRRLRATSDIPILMLTARVDEVDKLVGLSMGADDYVTKPFSPREVVARVRTILRRTTREPRQKVLQRGDLLMDLDRHRVEVAGREIRLTPVEFKLLQALLQSPERVFTRRAAQSHLCESRSSRGRPDHRCACGEAAGETGRRSRQSTVRRDRARTGIQTTLTDGNREPGTDGSHRSRFPVPGSRWAET